MTDVCTLTVGPEDTACLSGALTLETVTGLYRDMEKRLPGAGPISRVDLAGVSTADSAGLALLLEWQARHRKRGRALTITNAPGSLLRLAKLSEAIELLNISGRSEQA
jgi:phospholipid transport system transporter-binding protein